MVVNFLMIIVVNFSVDKNIAMLCSLSILFNKSLEGKPISKLHFTICI